MTTNHLDRLDPALIRPGRIDVAELIDDASPSQTRKLFLRFYEGERDEAELERAANEIAQLVEENAGRGRRISMAALQGHFIRHPIDTVVQSKGELFP
ncbi:hypothetical protein M407DRAFT_125096 [Tulasnella calospora MUT 4182]|nr:hypothetical protein M407DRAFT_125096 [Tulasnella calospora MUT 4182]